MGRLREDRDRGGGAVLFSQPIIDMASGVPCAEELLVRMIDPVNGRPINAGESARQQYDE